MQKTRVAVLISGNGSNLQALMDAARAPDYPAEIALVISNKANAYGLKRAELAGVTAIVIDHTQFPTREAFDEAMHAVLKEHQIEVICLAGFMRILSAWFVQTWAGRMLNIHPSLLPEFKGAHAVRDALLVQAPETGCTVHMVTEEMDEGPIIMQAKVPAFVGDTIETLSERIHAEEHRIYPAALKVFVMKL